MSDLRGKHAVIFGVASPDSIAWAIAKSLHQAGATISLGYQQRFKSRILQLTRSGEVPIQLCERCDVTKPEELEHFFSQVEQPIDILVHSIAYASPQTFQKAVRDVTQEEFAETLVTSSYSLLPLTRAALPKMPKGGSVITMTYLGGQRVVANYKLMGIAKAALEATVRELASDVGPHKVRVNAISAGPVRTLAASHVGNFDNMLKTYEATAPLRTTISQQDVGELAGFLASDASRNITGQTMFVDAGYSTLAMAELPSSSNTPSV